MKPDIEYHEIKTEVEVLFPASGAADLTDTVTGRTVIPETILLHLYRSVTPEQDGGREWAHVAVYGPRRLKDGTAGREISSFGWQSPNGLGPTYVDRPEWLTQALADHLPDGWNPRLLGLPGAPQ
jgi:hypothetical protein